MYSKFALAIAFALVAGSFTFMSAAEPAAPPSQPAVAKPLVAKPASSDPNWIGPGSWQRHFTIPSFVMTPKGMTMKPVTTRPEAERGAPTSYWASRQRRSSDSSTATSSTPRATRASRAEGSSERSSRSSDRGSRGSRGGRY